LELYANARTSQKARSTHGIVNSIDDAGGLRPSHQALLRLIDMTDPAWPSVAAVLREMADAGVEIDEAAVVIAAKLGAHRFAIAPAQKRPGRRSHQATLTGATADSIVYYIRRGKLIKIGTTADPVTRFDRLMPDEILAFEPGDAEQETLRHRQFDHLRGHGEHFRSAPELLEHIRQIRHLHGDPDPSWPSAVIPRKNREHLPLPPLNSHETVTASEACERLDLKVNTVWQWVYRGLIGPAGRNDRGHCIFYIEHLTVVRDRTAWRRRRAVNRQR
jgi:hypothetical protein